MHLLVNHPDLLNGLVPAVKRWMLEYCDLLSLQNVMQISLFFKSLRRVG